MISFGQELFGGCGFFFVPLEGLYAIIFVNPWLLLPTKSVVFILRSKVGRPYLSGRRRRRGGISMPVSFP